MLDKDEVTKTLVDGELLSDKIEANYTYLKDKYGEWSIGSPIGGVQISYINVSNALFSPLVLTQGILSLIFLLSSIIVGKILFPQLVKMYENNNKELIDITSLRTAEQVNNIAGESEKNKKQKKDWF